LPAVIRARFPRRHAAGPRPAGRDLVVVMYSVMTSIMAAEILSCCVMLCARLSSTRCFERFRREPRGAGAVRRSSRPRHTDVGAHRIIRWSANISPARPSA
jgi:hypothetical protein